MLQWVQAVEGEAVDEEKNGTIVAVCAWADGQMATLELAVDTKYCLSRYRFGGATIFIPRRLT